MMAAIGLSSSICSRAIVRGPERHLVPRPEFRPKLASPPSQPCRLAPGRRLAVELPFSYILRNLQFPEHDKVSPTATIGGLFTIGGASNFPQGRVQNSYQFSDTLSWLRGNHSIKFGTDIRRIQLFNLAAFDSKGT